MAVSGNLPKGDLTHSPRAHFHKGLPPPPNHPYSRGGETTHSFPKPLRFDSLKLPQTLKIPSEEGVFNVVAPRGVEPLFSG